MFIKKKNIIVAVLSSVLICIVLVSTIIGYMLYVQWKGDSFAAKYRISILKLKAEIFRNKIEISDIHIKYVKGKNALPVAEGSIKNNTDKTLSFLMVELLFTDKEGRVLYKNIFTPVGNLGVTRDYYKANSPTSGVLSPGDTLSFRHKLPHCPEKVLDILHSPTSFSKGSHDDLEIKWSIVGLEMV